MFVCMDPNQETAFYTVRMRRITGNTGGLGCIVRANTSPYSRNIHQ